MNNKADNVYYSASYIDNPYNFMISNLPEPKECNEKVLSFAAIIKNILQRSKTQIIPSRYLVSALGKMENPDSPFRFVRQNVVANWNNTIKGADNGFNPAYHFFYDLWPKYLQEFDYLRNYIIPEADFEKLVFENNQEWKNKTVDFYLPFASIVIEIDGSQHKEQNQRNEDRKRGRALNAAKIIVVRIPVHSIADEDEAFITAIERIRAKINDKKIVSYLLDDADTEQKLRDEYEAVLRYQITLLELIERGALDFQNPRWSFEVNEADKKVARIAFEDVLLTFENLYKLCNEDFNKPLIIINKRNESIRINNHGSYMKGDSASEKCVEIYSDYYPTDYFRVSSAELVNYNISWPINEKQNEALHFFLKNLFDFDEFNEGQLPIIANALSLRDTIGILPTGGGKSLCYFLSCILQPAPSFTVCPIISLLMDQEKNLTEFGITRTASISSQNTQSEKYTNITNFGKSKFLLTWISPERFQTEAFREALNKANNLCHFAYAVIDEVHCLSEWGHDFRTSYLTLIQTIRKYSSQTVLLGLTATASEAVLRDLKIEFGIDNTDVKATHSLGRPELSMYIRKADNKAHKFAVFDKMIRNTDFAATDKIGIVFASTKHSKFEEGCIDLTARINNERKDLSVATFHSGLSAQEKKLVQDAFMSDSYNVITATKAFGMGINKKNVRYTIHFGMPHSIESFYQEAGRAGRDKNKSDCYIIYNGESVEIQDSVDCLFSANSTSEEIGQARLSLKNDLSTIFYLWLSNNRGINAELEDIVWVIKKYRAAESPENLTLQGRTKYDSEKQRRPNQAGIEKALYHLKLLGIVNDWTIAQWEQSGQAIINVNFNNFDCDSVHKNFLNYVKKYNPRFDTDIEKESNKRYFDIIQEYNPKYYIVAHSKALITWIYEHVGYARRRAINNMRELCEAYQSDSDSAVFKQRIEDYLKIDIKSGLLDTIAQHPEQWRLWFDAFAETSFVDAETVLLPLSISGLNALRMLVARYIESYADNTGLNFIYLVSRILTDAYSPGTDNSMLENCMSDISSYEECDTIINKLIEVLEIYPNTQSTTFIIEKICDYFPEYAESLYNKFHDDYALAHFLKAKTKEIISITEAIR